MKLLFIRGPRLYWEYTHEDDNYFMPLNFLCLAAWLRPRHPRLSIRVVDAHVERMGWRRLGEIIRDETPDIVGVGEETMNANIGLRVLAIAKEARPATVTVAGGQHYAAALDETLGSGAVDFVVCGEGEHTLDELVTALENGERRFDRIRGLAWREDGAIVTTDPRPLIDDLDTLPPPAYDLVPCERYNRGGYVYRGVLPFFRSRGCNFGCSFCGFWAGMADPQRTPEGWKAVPRWRTMSTGRTLETIEHARRLMGPRFLFFTDATWDIDAAWNAAFAEEVLRRGLGLRFGAFLRGDNVCRDHASGTLDLTVRAGLVYAFLGGERADPAEMRQLSKPADIVAQTGEALRILARHHPRVLRHATFMAGIRSDTEASIRDLFAYVNTLPIDLPSGPLIFTPFPGTPAYDEARRNGWIEVDDFSRYDFMTPVMPTERLSRAELQRVFDDCRQRMFRRQPLKRLARLAELRDPHFAGYVLGGGSRFLLRQAARRLRAEAPALPRLVPPRWADD